MRTGRAILATLALFLLLVGIERIRHEEPAPPPAPAPGQVVLYATSWCGYCQKTRQLLAELQVPYFEYDIEKSAEGRRQREALGGRGVPVLKVGDTVIQGYDRNAMIAALK